MLRKWLVSGGDDGVIKVWDRQSGAEVRTLEDIGRSKLQALEITPDGKVPLVPGSRRELGLAFAKSLARCGGHQRH